MSYIRGEELDLVSAMQYFHANSIGEIKDLDGYLENPNFQTKFKYTYESPTPKHQF